MTIASPSPTASMSFGSFGSSYIISKGKGIENNNQSGSVIQIMLAVVGVLNFSDVIIKIN